MFKKTLIAAALAVAATCSFAQVYVQGAIGQGHLSGIDCTGLTDCKASSTGSKFVAGYELGNGFSVEGLLLDFGKASARLGTASAEAKVTALGIGGAWSTAINNSWSFKTGVALSQVKATESATGVATSNTSSTKPNLTLGLGYKINDTLTAISELDFSTAKDNTSRSNSVRLLSIGLRAKF